MTATEPRRLRTQAERDADGTALPAWDEMKARAERVTLPGHDRDCALAMLNQARLRLHGGIDTVQVEHLLDIGYRAGEQRGWHRGFDHARRYPAPIPPRRRWWHRYTRRNP